MKKAKQILSVLLAVVMLICAVPVMKAGATSKTLNDALAWVNSAVANRTQYGNGQCVALIRAYYEFLGVSPQTGNAKDYATNTPPSGWIFASSPSAGDIAVNTGSMGSGYGHVVIVTSVTSGSTFIGADQNNNGRMYVGTQSWKTSSFSKYIRPNFASPNPNIPKIEYTYLDYTLSDCTSFRPNCVVDASVVAIDRVSLAVWSVGSQSDLRWYDCSVGGPHGTIYYYDVPLSNHDSGAKSFVCDFYVYGTNGKSNTGRQIYDVDVTAPTISNISFKHVSGGYTVTCNVADSIGVTSVGFATWTPKNGQDDLLWQWVTPSGNSASCTIKASEHNNEEGLYITHIYAYDKMGNSSNKSAPDIYLGNYAFDVNGYLDGSNSGSLGSYGTFDLYFDGKLYKNDINDWANLIGCGTTFEIKDIKATAGHTYNGVKSGVIKGTMNGPNTVFLNFTTNTSTLKVNPNGGSWNGSTATQSFTQKYNTTKAIPVPTRNGYTFTGWTRSGTNGKLSSTTAAATYTYGATNNATDTITATWSCNHSSITIINAKDATYDADGYTGDAYCTVCKQTLSYGTSIPKLTKPEEPTNPTNPTDPTQPTDPTNPTNPTNPTQPATQPATQQQQQQSGNCKYCGGTHSGFPGIIIGFFHSILALFGLRK